MARRIQALAPSRTRILKIGHGAYNSKKPELLINEVKEAVGLIDSCKGTEGPDTLLIESNRILEAIDADLVIFIDAVDRPEKESAGLAKARADILIQEGLNLPEAKRTLRNKLGFDSALGIYEVIQNYYYEYLERKSRV